LSIRIEQIDQRSAPEETMTKLYELWCLWDAEALPDDPPEPYAQWIADMRHHLITRYSPKWLLYEGAQLAGMAAAYMNTEQNLENAHGVVHVHPDHRGRGHARRLTEVMVAELERQGRTRLGIGIPSHFEGRGLAELVGLSPVMREKRSRVRLAEIDQDLIRSWIDRGPLRASDYELFFSRSPMTEEIVEDFVKLQHVMNTAPREDYEEDDETFTVQEWRNRERDAVSRSEEIFTYVARRKSSGEFAGYTNIVYQGLYPQLAWQWDTGVDPAHRNKGLGRWLKAAMIEKVMESFPEVERIDTFNAGSNEAMLNINVEMGFKPILEEQVYQGPVSSVRAWLDGGPS
jgi:GNAT superfamily N-acetyltransferase